MIPARPVGVPELRVAGSNERVTRHARAGSRLQGAGDGGHLRLVPGRLVPGTRYEIVRWLGEGGMGVVYEVRHADIERRAALKVLRIDRRLDPELAQQFRDEARAASRIGSDHIVEIYDFGELPDRRLMFTMELLDGRSLVDELERVPISPARLIAILRQACKGLAAAHAQNIIHRDIKPENILLTTRKDGRADHVKIVDFGIARVATGDQVDVVQTAGTPHYMAPEMCLGMPYDGRVDMYALACTGYELLAGEPPFMGRTVEDVLRSQIDAIPERPSAKAGNVVPRPVEDVIMRCLEKNPADRYSDMRDLEAALCEAQIAARIDTDWDDLALPDVDPDRRARLLVAMPNPEAELQAALRKQKRRVGPFVAAAGLVTAVAIGAAWWLVPEQQPTRSNLVDELTAAAHDAGSKAYYVYPAAGDPYSATAYRKILELEALEGELEQAADVRGAELRTEFAKTLSRLGDRYWARPEGQPFAVEYYAQAILFEPTHPRARERVKLTPVQLADLQRRAASGEFTQAELEALEPLTILADADERTAIERFRDYDRRKADTSLRSGRAHQRFLQENGRRASPKRTADGRGDRADAPGVDVEVPAAAVPDVEVPAAAVPDVDTPPAVDARTDVRVATPRDPRRSRELVEAGRTALRDGKLQEAETLFNQALAADHRDPAAHVGLCDVYFERSAYERAVRFCGKAVRLAPSDQNHRIRYGDALFKILRYDEAEQQYRRAAELGHPAARDRLEKIRVKLGR